MGTRKLEKYLITETESIYQALKKIDQNAEGILFVVDDKRKLKGTLTDGDIRRTILKGVALEDSIHLAMNEQFIYVLNDASFEEIWKQFRGKYNFIPLVDKLGRITDYWAWDVFSRIPIAEPSLNGNEAKYVFDCLATNWISSTGQYISKFEESFAKFCGTKHAITVMNGTVSLHLALEALNVGPGDEIIIPSFTFIATANAVKYTGAKPVFVDCDRGTWTISLSEIKKAITHKTKGIIPVHIYGQPCDMDGLLDIAKKDNLWIIEDTAEALGAYYDKKPVGSFGQFGCFSFFGNKIITTGEGGMLVTNDTNLANKARMLRDHGMDPNKKYWHPEIGFNYRMTNIQAAIGLAQIEKIKTIIKQRARISEAYDKRLSNIPGIILPTKRENVQTVCWMYSILLDENIYPLGTIDKIITYFKQNRIESRPLFYPIYAMPPYQQNIYHKNAEYLSKNGISLPSFSTLNGRTINRVCNVLVKILDTI